jgi:hypothetical protein
MTAYDDIHCTTLSKTTQKRATICNANSDIFWAPLAFPPLVKERKTSMITSHREFNQVRPKPVNIPQKSSDYMVNDDDVQLCIAKNINQRNEENKKIPEKKMSKQPGEDSNGEEEEESREQEH